MESESKLLSADAHPSVFRDGDIGDLRVVSRKLKLDVARALKERRIEKRKILDDGALELAGHCSRYAGLVCMVGVAPERTFAWLDIAIERSTRSVPTSTDDDTLGDLVRYRDDNGLQLPQCRLHDQRARPDRLSRRSAAVRQDGRPPPSR